MVLKTYSALVMQKRVISPNVWLIVLLCFFSLCNFSFPFQIEVCRFVLGSSAQSQGTMFCDCLLELFAMESSDGSGIIFSGRGALEFSWVSYLLFLAGCAHEIHIPFT